MSSVVISIIHFTIACLFALSRRSNGIANSGSGKCIRRPWESILNNLSIRVAHIDFLLEYDELFFHLGIDVAFGI